jgi:predicted  nucleic acid-binding Zn-ribbon protein
MAHIAKYKATSVGHMLAHYRRDASSMERDNIDPKRVKNDMVVGHYTNKDGQLVVGRVVPREGEPNWGTVERRIERVNEAQKAAGKRATRKDAVVMADVVVTLPDNVRKGDEDRFFRLTYWYLSNKFGIDNMMGGFVHKDEVLKDGTPARDHMHVPFTPILDGRFNYKKMCPRTFYQNMHRELGDYLEKRLGYRPEVELDEETRAQRVYTDKSVDIDKVRGAVDRAVVQPAEDEAARIVAAARKEAAALLKEAETRKAELVTEIAGKEDDLAELDSQLEDVRMDIEGEEDRLECLRQEVEEMEAATPSLSEGVRTLWKARSDGSREDALGSDLEGLRSQISDLSSQITDVDRRADEIERGLPILRARCASLGERFGVARAAVVKAIEGLREVPNIVSEWAQELARKMGKPLFDPNSLDYQMREVTRVAKALDRDRPHVPQQRGRAR